MEATELLLTPITPGFSSEVHGINLEEPLSTSAADVLRRAFQERKLLLFRNQHGVSARALMAFASHFGVLEENPPPEKLALSFSSTSKDDRRLVYLSKEAAPAIPGIGPDNIWHSDATHFGIPPKGGLLRPLKLPPVGGDTLFADMTAAYNGLPEGLKSLCAGLRAVNDGALPMREPASERVRDLYTSMPPVEQPVIRTHPETGDKLIYVNPFWTSYIVGWSRQDSDELLSMLFRRANIPEYQCRIRWGLDTVVIFDNRCLQHYAVADYGNNPRVMERLTLRGDKPF